MPRIWYSTGIFDGDDLVFVGLDLVERGVERGGLAGAGGAGDEHHAVGLLDVAAEAREVLRGEADDIKRELGEFLAHRLFVEHAEHGVFAVHSGHDADAEVDEAALVANAETAVLRDAALGDVELGHDLDAGQDGLVVLARDGRHGLLQHAVDAVLDEERVVEGFEVDIGSAALERGEDGGVDEADDGGDVVVRGELLDGDVFVGVLFAGEHVEGEAFAGFVEHALRLLGFLEQVGDLRERGDAGDDARAEQAGDFVDHHELRRVGHGDGELAFGLLQRNEVVAEHHVDGHGLEELMLDFEVLEVDELCVVAASEKLRALDFRECVVGVRLCDGDGGHDGWTPVERFC